MNSPADAPLGLLSFLSFGFSIISAVLALDMYKLLRTGEFGRTWRLLIIASVMLALLQVLRMAEILNFQAIDEGQLAQIVELCFIMTLTYAFYCQRKVFTHEHKRNAQRAIREETLDDEDEWNRPMDETEDDFAYESEEFAQSQQAK